MFGRVTQGMMHSQLVRNLNSNMNRMDKLQNELATTRRINKPSDDPVGITFSLRYRSELGATTQYKDNVDTALSWLDNIDTTVGQAYDVLSRARDLTVQAANSPNPQSALTSIKSEIDQLYDQLVQTANTQFNGKYIFNGQMTDVKPYPATNTSATNSDDAYIEFEIAPSSRISVNVTGNEVFGAGIPTDSDNAFKALEDLSNALAAGDQTTIDASIDVIESRLDKMLLVRSSVGAKTNRIDLARNRLEDMETNLTELQSKVEDADIPATITNLKTAQNVYESSLSVGAQLIQHSLIDFLR